MESIKSNNFYLFFSKKILITASLLILFLASCSVKLYEPSIETVGKDADITKLKKGKELYVNTCAECHSLKKPEKYSADKWVELVEVMSKKAKISDEQASLILHYLTKGERE